FGPQLSADGAYVAFLSSATNLIPGQSGIGQQVFLYERATGTMTLVSRADGTTTTVSNAGLSSFTLSADGAYVAFASPATNLIPGQSGTQGVFLYERTTGTITLVSRVPGTSATSRNCASVGCLLSADGAYVAFVSSATNLVPEQSGSFVQKILLYERATGM